MFAAIHRLTRRCKPVQVNRCYSIFQAHDLRRNLLAKQQAIYYRQNPGCLHIARSWTKIVQCLRQSIMANRIKSRPMEFHKVMQVVEKQNDPTTIITMEIGGRTRLLNRPSGEKLSKFFIRVGANLKNAQNKKMRKVAKTTNAQSVHDDASIEMMFLDRSGNEISSDEILSDIWKKADCFILQDVKYRIAYNFPCVTKLKLPQTLIAGTLLYPKIEFEFANYYYSRFEWYRCVEQEGNQQMEVDSENENNTEKDDPTKWKFLHDQKTHLLSSDDAGHRFKLVVFPGNSDHQVVEDIEDSGVMTAYSGVVVPGQDYYLFDSRHEHTKNWCGENRFRVMTYNILADCYASTEYAQSDLFGYCPSNFLNMSYRIQILLKEIQGYHSDLIFLQEVDRFVFDDHLVPALSLQNYAGAFGAKRQLKEGVAIFYNRSKFKLVNVVNRILEDSLLNDPANSSLNEKLSVNPDLKLRVTQRASCVLISVLESCEHSGSYIITANTHLYWHPKATHIRLIQIAIVLNIMQNMRNELIESNPDNNVKCLLCGDLNASLNTSVLQLLQTGRVPSNHADWYSGGKLEYHNTDLSLSHDFKFTTTCGTPEYTNYVPGFSECIDYILVNPEHFNIAKVIPPPLHEHVIEHSALPSVKAPSDHIAQIVELTWNEDG
uniref:2',5'-phosphodiesterase 12 n=1 Tax=Phallusia mammillata TaxID=59560 RepID=A0A6F9DPA9_9ASCI|nr:2',5'-phosphodiesterase 12 [Phallusia mammillata]